jgi:uncharacterized membrane protein YbhN (UPF0104 family)
MNDLPGVLDEVGARLAGADLRLAGLALLLHITNHVLRSIAWRGVLVAAYPDRPVPLMRVLTGYAAGVALNAVAPARGGDAVKVGLVRASIPGSSVATIAATMSVLVALDVAIGMLLLLTVGLTGAIPLDFGGALDRLATAAPVATGVIAGVALLGYLARRRLRALVARLWQGGAVLRTPARYARAVALPQLVAWCCRVGVIMCLLAAFGLPATVALAALVMVVGGASTVVPLTPGGAGTQQVLLAVTLSQTASATAVVSFSLAMQAGVTLVNALLGVAAAMAMCGTLRPVRAVRTVLAGARA